MSTKLLKIHTQSPALLHGLKSHKLSKHEQKATLGQLIIKCWEKDRVNNFSDHERKAVDLTLAYNKVS